LPLSSAAPFGKWIVALEIAADDGWVQPCPARQRMSRLDDVPAQRAQLFKSHAALLYAAAEALPSQKDALFNEALAAVQHAGQSSASRAIQKASARIAAGDAESAGSSGPGRICRYS
jgi:hypothetical protein